MKWMYVFTMLLMVGCGLFKKTTKTKASHAQSSVKETEQSQMTLKTADKETRVFTYWNDSGFYQFQNIKERIDQVKSGQSKTQEKKVYKQEEQAKTSEPVRFWIYGGVACMIIICGYLFITYFKRP